MKTDKELLWLAAKAAGYNIKAHEDGTLYSDYRCSGYWGVFNPIRDDGDALRLAVKLNLEISPCCYSKDLVDVYSKDDNPVTEFFNGDPYAATRRAIVRAATVIGEKL